MVIAGNAFEGEVEAVDRLRDEVAIRRHEQAGDAAFQLLAGHDLEVVERARKQIVHRERSG